MTTPNLDELAERRLIYTDIERRDRVVPITAAERDWLVVQAREHATCADYADALIEARRALALVDRDEPFIDDAITRLVADLATVTRERDALREELGDLRRVGTRGGWR